MNTAQPTISQVDALWTLIQSQKRSVRQELFRRLSDSSDIQDKQESLRRRNEARLRDTLIPALREVKNARSRKAELPLVQELLDEL